MEQSHTTDEKLVDKEFTKNLVEMSLSGDKEARALFGGIFDNLIESEENIDDLIIELDEHWDENKEKVDDLITSKPLDQTYEMHNHYIRLCLAHTKAKMESEGKLGPNTHFEL